MTSLFPLFCITSYKTFNRTKKAITPRKILIPRTIRERSDIFGNNVMLHFGRIERNIQNVQKAHTIQNIMIRPPCGFNKPC